MFSGSNKLVEFLRGQVTQFKRGFAKAEMLVMCFVRDFRRFVVANLGAQSGDQHQRVLNVLLDAFAIDFHAD